MLRASLDRSVGLGVTWASLQSGHEAGATDRSTDLQTLRTCWAVLMYGECQKVPGSAEVVSEGQMLLSAGTACAETGRLGVRPSIGCL